MPTYTYKKPGSWSATCLRGTRTRARSCQPDTGISVPQSTHVVPGAGTVRVSTLVTRILVDKHTAIAIVVLRTCAGTRTTTGRRRRAVAL